MNNNKKWTKFELKESNMLDDLHREIQRFMDVDDFYDEYLYFFFLNGKEWDDSAEYAAPPEFQQEHCSRLTNIQLKELKLAYKQGFLYLYDYGDCLKYNVTIIGLEIFNDNKMYPHRIK
ncbi:MAG: IS1096 element passenger TnpR family protein [Promethearchaeota archaeon]